MLRHKVDARWGRKPCASACRSVRVYLARSVMREGRNFSKWCDALNSATESHASPCVCQAHPALIFTETWSDGSGRFPRGRGRPESRPGSGWEKSRPLFRIGELARCCETLTVHCLFTIDICLGKGSGIQCVILILPLSPHFCFILSPLALSLSLSNLPSFLSFFVSLSRFCTVSSYLCVQRAFLWNVMIHWLRSLWTVSLKSASLLSATAEWYITSITCNFLSFIRYIYSPYNGVACSFLQASSEDLSLAPWPCSWKPLSGVGTCQD